MPFIFSKHLGDISFSFEINTLKTAINTKKTTAVTTNKTLYHDPVCLRKRCLLQNRNHGVITHTCQHVASDFVNAQRSFSTGITRPFYRTWYRQVKHLPPGLEEALLQAPSFSYALLLQALGA